MAGPAVRVGTSRAPVVVRSVFDVPGSRMLSSLIRFGSAELCFLVPYPTLAGCGNNCALFAFKEAIRVCTAHGGVDSGLTGANTAAPALDNGCS